MNKKTVPIVVLVVLILAGSLAGIAQAGAVPSLHVGSIQTRYLQLADGSFSVLAVVAIHDLEHLAVPKARVSVQWVLPGGDRRDLQADTNREGQAQFSIRSREEGSYSLCVVDVAKSGWIYDPKRNHLTCTGLVVLRAATDDGAVPQKGTEARRVCINWPCPPASTGTAPAPSAVAALWPPVVGTAPRTCIDLLCPDGRPRDAYCRCRPSVSSPAVAQVPLPSPRRQQICINWPWCNGPAPVTSSQQTAALWGPAAGSAPRTCIDLLCPDGTPRDANCLCRPAVSSPSTG